MFWEISKIYEKNFLRWLSTYINFNEIPMMKIRKFFAETVLNSNIYLSNFSS